MTASAAQANQRALPHALTQRVTPRSRAQQAHVQSIHIAGLRALGARAVETLGGRRRLGGRALRPAARVHRVATCHVTPALVLRPVATSASAVMGAPLTAPHVALNRAQARPAQGAAQGVNQARARAAWAVNVTALRTASDPPARSAQQELGLTDPSLAHVAMGASAAWSATTAHGTRSTTHVSSTRTVGLIHGAAKFGE